MRGIIDRSLEGERPCEGRKTLVGKKSGAESPGFFQKGIGKIKKI